MALIYQRRNGQLGSSCEGISDTGHHITSRVVDGLTLYTVHSIHHGEIIKRDVVLGTALKAIDDDWRMSGSDYLHGGK